MATKNVYTCDQCKESWDVDKKVPRQLWRIMIFATCYPNVSSSFGSEWKGADWCEACMAKCGLLERDRTLGIPIPNPPPTVEDIIREIVREEI